MTISRVSVVSTGSVRIRPQHVERSGAPMAWWLLTTRRWTGSLPINVYVIEHSEGLVLFDTGQDRSSVTDASYFPRGLAGLAFARLADFEIAEGETLAAQLATAGYDIADVKYAVISHLHQDHMGGLYELQHAEIITSAAELTEARKPMAEFGGFLKKHIFIPGLRWREVELEPTTDATLSPFTEAADLFGDGSLVLLPTPGHTPGSTSLLVRQEGQPPLLLVGDLTYDVDLLPEERIPGVGNRGGLLASTRAVAGLKARHPELVVLAAHDPAAASLLQASRR